MQLRASPRRQLPLRPHGAFSPWASISVLTTYLPRLLADRAKVPPNCESRWSPTRRHRRAPRQKQERPPGCSYRRNGRCLGWVCPREVRTGATITSEVQKPARFETVPSRETAWEGGWRGPESNRRHHDFQGRVGRPIRQVKTLQIGTLQSGHVEAGYRWILADIGGFGT